MATRNRIRAERDRNGFSQEEFASFAGVALNTYQIHESNPDQFRLGELMAISDNLDYFERLNFVTAIVQEAFDERFDVNEKG